MAGVDGVFSSRRVARLAEENVVICTFDGWINLISGQFAGLKPNADKK